MFDAFPTVCVLHARPLLPTLGSFEPSRSLKPPQTRRPTHPGAMRWADIQLDVSSLPHFEHPGDPEGSTARTGSFTRVPPSARWHHSGKVPMDSSCGGDMVMTGVSTVTFGSVGSDVVTSPRAACCFRPVPDRAV